MRIALVQLAATEDLEAFWTDDLSRYGGLSQFGLKQSVAVALFRIGKPAVYETLLKWLAEFAGRRRGVGDHDGRR